MDYLAYLGLIATGTRLKRLSETYMAEAQRAYQAAGLRFEPKWFALFSLVSERPGLSIGEASSELGLSHVAIGKLAKELAAEGLLEILPGAKDRRRSDLSLSEPGRAMHDRLQPLWALLEEACQQVSDQTSCGILRFLHEQEQALEGRPISEHVIARLGKPGDGEGTILDYAPRYREDFERLNLEWISRYFEVEDADREVLADPERMILKDGGAVLFARLDGRIVGTCGLKRRSPRTAELVKMAVTETVQGKGVGRKLLEAAIAKARALGFDTLYLETNDRLESAVALYRKLGFREVPAAEPSPYARSNVFMERRL
jgi:GNAT superfamily N-acetyltransferase